MTDDQMEVPQEIIAKFTQDEKEFEEACVQCGLIGVSGTGKSSLINALAGKTIAEVGVNETTGVTSEISKYEFHNIIIIDLPGVGTRNWKTETYFSDLMKISNVEMDKVLKKNDSLAPENFDFFILVLANRILEEDFKLYKLITEKLGKKCFIVRSKFDLDANNNFRTKMKSDQETYQEIQQTLWKYFPEVKRDEIFIISALEPARGDFERLRESIIKSLPKIKADKFLAYTTAYTENAIKKKREISEKHAQRLALISACNAFNPIPGLNFAADLGLLMKLSRDLLEIYGLTEEQLDYEIRIRMHTEAWGSAIKRRIVTQVKSYSTKEGIFAILRYVAPKLQKDTVARWIPLIGQSVAAVMNYRLTYAYAQLTIDRCEEQALAVLHELQSHPQQSTG